MKIKIKSHAKSDGIINHNDMFMLRIPTS